MTDSVPFVSPGAPPPVPEVRTGVAVQETVDASTGLVGWAEELAALDAAGGILGLGPLPEEIPDDEPAHMVTGALIAGRFRVVRLLGRGGHGFVYEAEHVVLGYPVAIKVLHAAYGHDPMRRARFRREALLGSRLRHRNVVSIHDAGELPDGSPFLVMEHVDGTDLSTVIETARLGAAATVEVGVQLLAAVTALSARGVIHRDIKPNNVMLQRTVDGYCEIKLLDFGISKAMHPEFSLKELTLDNCVLGTPQYMSPEQVRGAALDVRSDLYAVGALLYECITGVPPFDAETAGGVLAKILTEEARPTREVRPDVPEALGALIDRAVQKKPDDRWSTPVEMSEALRTIAVGLGLPRGADAWKSADAEPPASPSPAAVSPRAEQATPVLVDSTAPTLDRHDEIRDRVSRGPEPRSSSQRRWSVLAAVIAGGVISLALGAWMIGGALEGASSENAPSSFAPKPATPSTAPAGTVTPEVAVPEPALDLPRGADTPAISAPAPRGRAAVDPAELERRALAAFMAGRGSEAISLYTRATEIAPSRASAWRGLGLAASSAGDRATASSALRRYLALAPNAPDRASIEQRLAGVGP